MHMFSFHSAPVKVDGVSGDKSVTNGKPSLLIEWNDDECTERYLIQYAVSGTEDVKILTTNNTIATLTDLEVGTIYEVSVRSVRQSGPGAFFTFTTYDGQYYIIHSYVYIYYK